MRPLRGDASRGGGQEAAHAELVAGELGHDGTAAEYQGTVADMGDFLEIRGDDEDGQTLGQCLVEQAVDLGLGTHVDAGRGLLQDQQVPRDAQPAGYHDLLLVAAGQGLDRPRRLVGSDPEAPADLQGLH
jgi:hypothetical protein